MKIRLILSLVYLALLMLLGSCSVKELPFEGGYVCAVMEDEPTRTAVTDAGTFTWSAGDLVWLQTSSGSVVGALSSGAGTPDAQFAYEVPSSELTGKAIYPYNSGHSISGDELDFVLPISYDLGSNLSNTNAAMYGVNLDGCVRFNHLAGVMRFAFRNVPAGTDKFQITLDKKINGVFTADLTTGSPVIETVATETVAERMVTLNFTPLESVSDIALYVPLPVGTYASLYLNLWAGEDNVWSYSNTVTNTISRKTLKLMPIVTLKEGSTDLSDQLQKETEAMLEIWRALDGPNWKCEEWDIYNTWNEGNPIQEWGGLHFHESGTIKSLSISTLEAKGILPDVFDAFTELESLTIDAARITGAIPASIGRLANLKELRVTGAYEDGVVSGLSGPLPDMSGLSSIETIYMHGCKMDSPIPNSIGTLKTLRFCSMQECCLNGELPETIGNLTELQTLRLSENYLEGNIPESLCNLTGLTELDLSSNLMTGTIPDAIGNMTSLEYLYLRGHSTLGDYEHITDYRNTFSGEIPSSIGRLTNLRHLILSDNKLSGEIPESIYGLENLTWLDLSFNDLQGEISPKISQLQNLGTLNLSTNRMNGVLPDEIWELTKLNTLNLSNSYTRYGAVMTNENTFTGPLSYKISNLKNLTNLSVANCDFSGEIPASITNLHNLQDLRIQNNSFTGTIPDAMKDMELLDVFWCQDNKLSGYISSEFMEVLARKNQNGAYYWIITDQREGYGFVYDMYESKDYSQHMKVKQLRTATVGNGVDVVLMGEAFVDKDIQDGSYDKVMETMCDAIFAMEPYKFHEDYFNVYEIVLVSKNNTELGETALSSKSYFGGAFSTYSVNKDELLDIINQVLPELEYNNLTISIATKIPSDRPGCSTFDDPAIAITYVPDDEDFFKETICHEVCGHAFGKLADEYVEYAVDTPYPVDFHPSMNSYHEKGWYANVDITSDPTKIFWSKFLAIPEYISSGTGIFEGAEHYGRGIWRASESSIMRSHNGDGSSFNAPSREAIYKRIHQIALGDEWEYDFNEFLKWDMRNL